MLWVLLRVEDAGLPGGSREGLGACGLPGRACGLVVACGAFWGARLRLAHLELRGIYLWDD